METSNRMQKERMTSPDDISNRIRVRMDDGSEEEFGPGYTG
jgi:hypothetical protein